MILNVKKKKLEYGLQRKDIYKLTTPNVRLLLLLSDNEAHTIQEISDWLYIYPESLYVIIHNLKKKIPILDITAIRKYGYRLEDEIFIDK